MIDLIRKITADTKESKVGSLLSLSESHIAFVVDSIFIDLLEYNRKDKKVFLLYFEHLKKNYQVFLKSFKEYNTQ